LHYGELKAFQNIFEFEFASGMLGL